MRYRSALLATAAGLGIALALAAVALGAAVSWAASTAPPSGGDDDLAGLETFGSFVVVAFVIVIAAIPIAATSMALVWRRRLRAEVSAGTAFGAGVIGVLAPTLALLTTLSASLAAVALAGATLLDAAMLRASAEPRAQPR